MFRSAVNKDKDKDNDKDNDNDNDRIQTFFLPTQGMWKQKFDFLKIAF